MKSMTKFDELWTDYLEGELDDAQHHELREFLKDPLVLEKAVEQFQLHRLLNLQAQSSDENQRKFVAATMDALPISAASLLQRVQADIHASPDSGPITKKRIHSNHWGWIAGLAAAICFAAWLWLEPQTPPDMIRIAAVDGTVTLTSSDAPGGMPVKAGSKFLTGTLELKTPGSWCELEFADQTATTISGPARVILTGGKQKVIRLDRGRISANVTPQPHQRPLLVLTDAAELEAPGNRFNIEAESAGTRLVVNQGTVKIKRKTDGQVAEVPANHSIAALLNTRDAMTVLQRPDAVSSWKANLNTETRAGVVVTESDLVKKRLASAVKKGKLSKSQALEEFKKQVSLEDVESVWATATPYGNLIMLSVSSPTANPVSILPQARFRITGRISPDAPLTVGFNTQHSEGGFAGKYFIKLEPSELKQTNHPDSLGDQESMQSFVLELPLDRFLLKSKSKEQVIGNELSEWWCVTDGKTKLQILNVELVDHPIENSVSPNSL